MKAVPIGRLLFYQKYYGKNSSSEISRDTDSGRS